MKLLKTSIFVIALAFFIWIIMKAKPYLIWHEIILLKWRIFVVILAYLVIYFFDTMGWRWSFRKETKLPNLMRLFIARQAGEALNYTTPTAYIGGEPIKALVLKKRYGINLIDGLSSVVVAKTALFLSQVIFLLIGIILSLRLLKFKSVIATGILGTFMGIVGLFLIFIILQRKGLFKLGLKLLERLKLGKMFEDKKPRLEELDEAITNFYIKEKFRFVGSFIFHLLGWFAGVIEVYIILYFLGIPIDWTRALIIEVFFKTANSAFFFVPAALGVQEGAGYAILAALGLGGTVGVALSIVKRIREIAWAGVGLFIFATSREDRG